MRWGGRSCVWPVPSPAVLQAARGIRFPGSGSRFLGRPNPVGVVLRRQRRLSNSGLLASTAYAPAFVQGSGLSAASLAGDLDGRSIDDRRAVKVPRPGARLVAAPGYPSVRAQLLITLPPECRSMSARVPCSEHVKDRLDEIKDAEQHQTYDSVLRTLLASYEDD